MGRRYISEPGQTMRPAITDSDVASFWRFVSVPEDGDDCWEWVGLKGKAGYGIWPTAKKRFGTTAAHRAAYTMFVGVIQRGLHVDHLCRNPPCVRPDHLEPVTALENMRRKPGVKPAVYGPPTPGHISRKLRRQDKESFLCGHPATPENRATYYHNVNDEYYDVCRLCKRQSTKTTKKQKPKVGAPLSGREEQAYLLALLGHRNAEIAERMGVRLERVERLLSQVRHKLQIPTGQTVGNRPQGKRGDWQPGGDARTTTRSSVTPAP